jgi:hypothetical protein
LATAAFVAQRHHRGAANWATKPPRVHPIFLMRQSDFCGFHTTTFRHAGSDTYVYVNKCIIHGPICQVVISQIFQTLASFAMPPTMAPCPILWSSHHDSHPVLSNVCARRDGR